MAAKTKRLAETHQLGGSKDTAVKSSGDDARGWLAAAPECPAMERKTSPTRV